MREQVAYHNIMEKIRELQEKADQSLWTPPEDIALYKMIDRLNSEIMRHADKCLLRKVCKTYEWSPKLAMAVQSVRFWRLKLKRVRSLLISDNILQNTKIKAALRDEYDIVRSQQNILEH